MCVCLFNVRVREEREEGEGGRGWGEQVVDNKLGLLGLSFEAAGRAGSACCHGSHRGVGSIHPRISQYSDQYKANLAIFL